MLRMVRRWFISFNSTDHRLSSRISSSLLLLYTIYTIYKSIYCMHIHMYDIYTFFRYTYIENPFGFPTKKKWGSEEVRTFFPPFSRKARELFVAELNRFTDIPWTSSSSTSTSSSSSSSSGSESLLPSPFALRPFSPSPLLFFFFAAILAGGSIRASRGVRSFLPHYGIFFLFCSRN